jgi:hypothetical protein
VNIPAPDWLIQLKDGRAAQNTSPTTHQQKESRRKGKPGSYYWMSIRLNKTSSSTNAILYNTGYRALLFYAAALFFPSLSLNEPLRQLNNRGV